MIDSRVDILGLLTIVFIVLKLANVINWSWWLVLSPILLPFVIAAAILFIADEL